MRTLMLALGLAAYAAGLGAAPLKVCATVPELGDFARRLGGEQVQVTVFAKGSEDPHFLDARPSWIPALAAADLLLESGLDLEVGWLPPLLDSARNARIREGSPGRLVAAALIRPLDVRDGASRADGDVHAGGNPHFLLDPLQGFKVAKAVTAALARLRPTQAAAFEGRYAQFRQDLGRRLFGADLADRLDVEKLAEIAEAGRLHAFLKSQGLQDRLGGWLGTAQAWAGKAVVDDHPLWAYFARSFGLRIVGHLEPKPGFAPSTRHLQALVGLMKEEDAQAVLASAYYDRRHADWVARHSGAKVALLANQMGSRPGTDDYLSWVDYNVKTLDQALRR
jgi:zinc/manganese transport system substrate-binding protein